MARANRERGPIFGEHRWTISGERRRVECLEAREHFERTLVFFSRCASTYLEMNMTCLVGIWRLLLLGELADLSRRLALILAEV